MTDLINYLPPEFEPIAQRLYKVLFDRSYGDRTDLICDAHYFYMEEHMSAIRKALQEAYMVGINTE